MILDTIMLLGAFQGLIMSGFLWAKKDKKPAENVLALWIPLMAIHLSLSYLLKNDYVSSDLLIKVNSSIPFLQAPMIYLYFSVLFLGKVKTSRILVHFMIPALGFLVYLFQWNLSWLLQILFWYLIFSVPAYGLWILVSWLRLSHKSISTLKQQSKWLIYPLAGLILIWASFLILWFVPSIRILNLHTYFFIAVTIFVYLIAFHLFQMGQKNSFEFLKEPSNKASSIESALKYSRSGLSVEKAEELHRKLNQYMEEEKPYLNPELNLSLLASKLEIRPNHLSQVINERAGLSLNEYLNKFRVQEFILLCQKEENKNKPLLRIAFQAGFNSKSSFNRVFRKELGVNPSEYRSRLNTR